VVGSSRGRRHTVQQSDEEGESCDPSSTYSNHTELCCSEADIGEE